jgi:parallel beta-helix repeat protein/predicted outer membrane repeat protein
LSVVAAVLAGPAVLADTLHVPGQYATIQAAIDAADDTDVVEIANGTYTGTGNKNLDFGGRAITVRSAAGDPALCIIDCQGDGRGFDFHSNEGPNSIVEGLTITNGGDADGFGISGAGVSCSRAGPTLTNCRFSGNSAFPWGGGLSCYDGSNPRVTNCTFSGNQAGGGGGISCHEGSNPSLVNCTFIGNSADGGVGVYCDDSSPTLTNCTFSGNTADGPGGGISCHEGSNPRLTNCILWGDTPDEIRSTSGSSPIVTYCDVQGGWTGAANIIANPQFVDLDGPDNDPSTWEDNDYRLSAGSPCIDAGNNTSVPADTVDLDDDGDTAEPLPFDLDGNARFAEDPDMTDTGYGTRPIVDMGAYEACSGDLDGDGVLDCVDGCPDDPNKGEPGVCGCGVSDADSDGDGTVDCNDGCPDDPNKTEPGICGCGVSDADSDGDGTVDCNDGCPDDPDKTEPSVCGCGVADVDTDDDEILDCLDNCPDTANPDQADADGDGVGDACTPPPPPAAGCGACGTAGALMMVFSLLGIWVSKRRHRPAAPVNRSRPANVG